jgi:hypothetical protein
MSPRLDGKEEATPELDKSTPAEKKKKLKRSAPPADGRMRKSERISKKKPDSVLDGGSTDESDDSTHESDDGSTHESDEVVSELEDDSSELLPVYIYTPSDGMIVHHSQLNDKDIYTFKFNTEDDPVVVEQKDQISPAAMRAWKIKQERKQKFAKFADVLIKNEKDGDQKFLADIKHRDALLLLKVLMDAERVKRSAEANVVDLAWTDVFFQFSTQNVATGKNMERKYMYKERKMARWLVPSGTSWFGVMQGDNHNRVSNDYFEIGMGTVPGGKEGFGVYAKENFVMKEEYVQHFQDTMKYSAYVLDRKLMRQENITLEEVLKITSMNENGGLNCSTLNTTDEVTIAHGGTLATLMNHGGSYAKMEYLPNGTDKDVPVKSENVMFDDEFARFLNNNPSIRNAIAKHTLIPEGHDDDTGAAHPSGRPKRRQLITVGESKYVGLRVPWYYAVPKIGESFVKGEQVFSDYVIVGEPSVSLNTDDERFMGTASNGGYSMPLAFKERLEAQLKEPEEKTPAAPKAKKVTKKRKRDKKKSADAKMAETKTLKNVTKLTAQEKRKETAKRKKADAADADIARTETLLAEAKKLQAAIAEATPGNDSSSDTSNETQTGGDTGAEDTTGEQGDTAE